MPSEKIVNDMIKDAGYTPIKGRAIIATYAPANLSEKIARFFSNEFSFCRCAKIHWYCCLSGVCPLC